MAVLAFAVAMVATAAFAGEAGEKSLTHKEMKTELGFLRVSELIDKTVEDVNGNELGEIEDVVISQNHIRYIVLSRDDKLIPIPFREVSTSTVHEDNLVVRNIDEKRLESAPTFTEQDWDRLADPTFERSITGYYGEDQPKFHDPAKREMPHPEMGSTEPPGTGY